MAFMVSDQLEALAVATRRAIYTTLLDGPRSVGEIANEMPVSRPAVSQHLKVLADAGLVEVSVSGNRHYYSARPDGLEALRSWTDQMWEQAMGRFAQLADRKETKMEGRIDAVVKRITVPGTAAEAFALFTERVGEWWPLPTHSVAGDDAVDARIDPQVGGRFYEVTKSGEEHDWGSVLQWEQDRRLVLDWYPGLPSAEATRLEISFLQLGDSTEVTLVHDGWEARGDVALERRDGYDTGWDQVLGLVPGVGSVVSVRSVAEVS